MDGSWDAKVASHSTSSQSTNLRVNFDFSVGHLFAVMMCHANHSKVACLNYWHYCASFYKTLARTRMLTLAIGGGWESASEL